MSDMPLVLLVLVSFGFGLWDGGGPESVGGLGYLVYGLVSVGLVFWWVWRDAERREAKLSWALRVMLACLTVFALPYYFFRSRGWRGGFRMLVQGWGVFVGAMLAYRLGASL